jgi:hypothetical protein
MLRPEWKVLPHGTIEAINGSLRVVEGTLPNMPLKRVMSVVRLASGGLLLHSCIALDAARLSELEAWGPPTLMLVPNAWHRLDAPAFKARYPSIKVYCPRGAVKRVRQVVPVDGTYEDLPPTAPVKVAYLDGVAEREGYLELRAEDGVSLIFNDAIFNQPHLPGVFGRIYRWLGSSGSPRVTPILKLAMVKDRAALRAHLGRLAETPNLRRLVIMHGTRIEDRPADVLRQAAATV